MAPRQPAALGLVALTLAACTPGPSVPATAWPPIRGRVGDGAWQVAATAGQLANGTVSLIQPANGLTVAAGNSAGDGSFTLFLPPSVRPATGSAWYLDVTRRVSGRALGLRTVVQWDGSAWLSCTGGSDAAAELAVTTATTAAARIAERSGLPLSSAIGRVRGSQISLPSPVDPAWSLALHTRLRQALAAGRDPLAISPAVVVSQVPEAPRGGDLVAWQGFGFGNVAGKVQVGERILPLRLWQERLVQVGLPAGLPPGGVRLTLANGEVLTPGDLAVPDSWRVRTPMGVPRGGDSLAVGAIGETVYVAGGQDGRYEAIGTLEALDGDGRTRLEPLPTARYGLGGAVLDGRLYAVGGMAGGGPSRAVEAFDPGAGTWSRSSDLPVALHQPAVCASGSLLLVAGGDTGSGLSDRIYRWQSGGTWQASSARLSVARAAAAAVPLADGRVLICGGRDDAWQALATVDIYDPLTDSVSAAPALQVARYSHGAARVGDRVVLAGGWQDAFGALASSEGWRPGQDAWRPLSSLPAPRYGATAVTVGPSLWLVAGANDGEGSGADVLEYVP